MRPVAGGSESFFKKLMWYATEVWCRDVKTIPQWNSGLNWAQTKGDAM